MKYIEQLLQRQAQIAAKLESQSAPPLRLYPDGIWLEMPQMEQSAEEAFVGGAEILQENAADEMYRQLMRLESVREQRARMAILQAQEASGLTPRMQAGTEAAMLSYGQGTNMAVQETQRQAFGLLSQNYVSQHSMERISRFFERDARRYGG